MNKLMILFAVVLVQNALTATSAGAIMFPFRMRELSMQERLELCRKAHAEVQAAADKHDKLMTPESLEEYLHFLQEKKHQLEAQAACMEVREFVDKEIDEIIRAQRNPRHDLEKCINC